MKKYLSILALVLLASCGKKEIAPPTELGKPEISQDEMLSAMLRGHPNSRRVCIDGLRTRAFFLDYGPPQKPGEQADSQFHGWLFIELVDFYKTSNNTWFIVDQDQKKYVQSYPDVSGLICSDRTK